MVPTKKNTYVVRVHRTISFEMEFEVDASDHVSASARAEVEADKVGLWPGVNTTIHYLTFKDRVTDITLLPPAKDES